MKKRKIGWRTYIPFSTGEFIRGYLLEHGEAYIHETWIAFKEALEPYIKRMPEMVRWWGSYASFRRYFYILKKLGMIELVRTEPSERPKLQPRHYYRIVPGREDLMMVWSHPQVVMYPETVWGRKDYLKRKKEAETLGVTVRELTLRDRPRLRELRERLGIE